ncbi:hypothetical protein D3C75_743460 [compost metagenome]
MDLDQGQLPGHHGVGAQVHHLDDVDDLVQLLFHLLHSLIVASGYDNHAGKALLLGFPHRYAFDIKAPPAEEAGYPLQDAGLVIHKN